MHDVWSVLHVEPDGQFPQEMVVPQLVSGPVPQIRPPVHVDEGTQEHDVWSVLQL